jgi:O-antigen/teichoic acid export membrane protein
MSVIRRLVRNSLVYAVANALQKLTGLLLIPLYTRVLSVESYGVMELLSTLTNSAMILSTLGLSSALNKCFHRDCEGPEDRERLTGTAIWLLTPTSLGLALVGYVWGAPISAWLLGDARSSELVFLALISAACFTLSQIPLTLLRAQEASVTYGVLSLFQFVSMTGLNIWLVGHLRMGVRGVLLGAIGSSIVVLLASAAYLFKHATFQFSPRLSRALLGFGLAMVPVAICTWIMNVSDRWMLGFLTNKEEVGLYGIGYRFGMIVQYLLVAPFQLAWPAFYFREASKPNARDLYAKVFVAYVAVGGCLTLAVSLGGEVLLRLMASPAYWPGATVIPWVAAAYFLNGCLYCVVPGVQLGGKTHLQPLISLSAAGSNVLVNFLLIPRLGMLGAAISTVLSFALAFALTAYLSQKAYAFKFGGAKSWQIIAGLLAAASIGLAIDSDSLITLSLGRGVVILIAAGWIVIWCSREFGLRWNDRGADGRAWWKLTSVK